MSYTVYTTQAISLPVVPHHSQDTQLSNQVATDFSYHGARIPVDLSLVNIGIVSDGKGRCQEFRYVRYVLRAHLVVPLLFCLQLRHVVTNIYCNGRILEVLCCCIRPVVKILVVW